MKFAEFIRANVQEIADQWESFAATLLPDEEFSSAVLRNSVEELLKKIADDMERPQSKEQQSRKSKGQTPSKEIEDIAIKHVGERIEMGLSSRQLISEFRALRASVIRLWQKDRSAADKEDLDNLTRFNEAVDEALTQAQACFSIKEDKSRELFLGILAHDFRNPLNAIAGSAELILREPDNNENAALANQILVSVERMSHMVTDLSELTRLKLGKGVSINPARIRVKELCRELIEEMEAAHPDQAFLLDMKDDLYAEWDKGKISQALSNLLGNAVQHGAPDKEISLRAGRSGDRIVLEVHNEGPPIPRELIPQIFELFTRDHRSNGRSGSMGLGLFIAREVVIAHGGWIDVRSTDAEGTTFSVHLPEAAQRHASKNRHRTDQGIANTAAANHPCR